MLGWATIHAMTASKRRKKKKQLYRVKQPDIENSMKVD